jgi:hypothetical protein
MKFFRSKTIFYAFLSGWIARLHFVGAHSRVQNLGEGSLPPVPLPKLRG